MPTLAERIQAALERHTAEVASILASASMAEVVAFTQAKGAVASPLAAVPPEPAGPPDDKDPDGEPKPAQPPKWAVRRAEDERLTLSVLRFLAKNGGSSPVSRVAKELCPKNMGVRDFSRRVTTFRKHKGEVICRTRSRIFIVFDLTDAGKQWLDELGIPVEQAGSDTAPKADTVSKVETRAKADERALLEELKAAVDRGEKLHRWDEAFLSSYRHEIGLGLPGQEAAGVAYYATEQDNGPRPCGIQYGVLLNDITDAVKSALEGIPDPGMSLAEVVRKTGRFINAIDMKRLMLDGVVCIKGIQGTDYYSMAPKTEERQKEVGEGLMQSRMDKVVEYLRHHPWSTRIEIARDTGVAGQHIADLDNATKPIMACRKWKEVVEVSKKPLGGQMVKVYALRGAEPWRQKRGPKTNKLRDRLDEALAWLSLNPGSTLKQIADGIGTSQRDLLNSINVVKTNRNKWHERVEVTGDDLRYKGVARTYRVKA